ncbi:hypothetical protein HPB47_028344 [Ixodes persulcatus]|uniref:Uncharacterized protein n=1 Tax=Ixodes persulcatus TaxID=34615 RepID=A0AC60PTF4_IXOPE|nr:hypothetical protein HPB47_028344 [Ixodes persulcatus]
MDLRRGNSSSANAGAWPQQVPSPEAPMVLASETVRQSSAAAPSTTKVARTSHPSPPLAQKPLREQGKLEDRAAYLIEKQPDPKEAETVATASGGTPERSFEPSPKNTKALRQEDIQHNNERSRPRTLKRGRKIREGDVSPCADHGSESPEMSKGLRRTDEGPVLKSPQTEMERPRMDIPAAKVSGKEKTRAEIPSYKTSALASARQQEIHSPGVPFRRETN